MADLYFTGKFEVMKQADAPLALHELLASGEASGRSFTIHRNAVGLGMWVNIGGLRITIPIGDILHDAVQVGLAASTEAKKP